jgi:tryptophanyl-tRNA synthetase
MARPRILSGMRPTGRLHIGHFFGALQNWVALQDSYECFYMVADWHAVMSEYKDTSSIVEYSYDNVADWLACGIDPEKSTVFIQSQVPEHAELHLILSAYTPLSWLERVPTYKEAVQELKAKEIENYAFLGYPVLQAADILLYRANAVPVGEDQLPHLELCREIVRRFNHVAGQEILVEPQAKLTPAARLLGVDRRKMSKSYNNAINLSDEPDAVKKKAQSMITDESRIKRSDPGHPDVCNVFSYHRLFNPERVESIRAECASAKIGCVECKQENAAKLAEFLKPMQEKRADVLKNPKRLRDIVEAGNARARREARATLDRVRAAIFKS